MIERLEEVHQWWFQGVDARPSVAELIEICSIIDGPDAWRLSFVILAEVESYSVGGRGYDTTPKWEAVLNASDTLINTLAEANSAFDERFAGIEYISFVEDMELQARAIETLNHVERLKTQLVASFKQQPQPAPGPKTNTPRLWATCSLLSAFGSLDSGSRGSTKRFSILLGLFLSMVEPGTVSESTLKRIIREARGELPGRAYYFIGGGLNSQEGTFRAGGPRRKWRSPKGS